MKRFQATIYLENDCKTLAEGLKSARETLSALGLQFYDIKPVQDRRTLSQNSALHKWFELIEEEARTSGQTMDMLIKNPAEVPITRHLLKDIFRLIGKQIFHKDSTAKLNKEEFREVQLTFEKVIAERLGIDIPFPSIELFMETQ